MRYYRGIGLRKCLVLHLSAHLGSLSGGFNKGTGRCDVRRYCAQFKRTNLKNSEILNHPETADDIRIPVLGQYLLLEKGLVKYLLTFESTTAKNRILLLTNLLGLE